MSMIGVEDLSFSYPTSPDSIFEHVSFTIDTDWKLGLIGRNGRGKTTLLRLLQGEEEYSGRIQSSVMFDYFPYRIKHEDRMTEEILMEICPQAEEWELLRELSYLEVRDDALWRPFSTLSNGEKTKAELAALFLNEGHFLLIDEPTNHLDMRAREIVASYLKRKKGFILVSHDRWFLDQCVDHILAINRTDIQVTAGNFSTWYENFNRQQDYELARNEKLKKDIDQMKTAARRTSSWSDKTEASKFGNGPVDRGFVGKKSAKMMKRAKSIELRRQKAIDEKEGLLKNAETAEDLKLFPLTYMSDRLVSCVGVAPVIDGQTVCGPVTFEIRQGDRIALDGRNGAGKSSFLKLLTGDLREYTGTLTVGSGLVISCVPQDASGLSGSLAEFTEHHQLDGSLFYAVLRKLGFERTQFEKSMDDYSAGQKKKVLLAKSLCERAHLYVWDEPLNYIDIYSRMQIENLIRTYAPTMIFVEHDRAFREAVATETIELGKW